MQAAVVRNRHCGRFAAFNGRRIHLESCDSGFDAILRKWSLVRRIEIYESRGSHDEGSVRVDALILSKLRSTPCP